MMQTYAGSPLKLPTSKCRLFIELLEIMPHAKGFIGSSMSLDSAGCL